MGALSALYVGVNGFTSTCLPVLASIWQCFPITTMLACLSSSVHIVSALTFIISSASYINIAITSYSHWLYIYVCGCCVLLSICIFHFLLSPWIPICAQLLCFLFLHLSPLRRKQGNLHGQMSSGLCILGLFED